MRHHLRNESYETEALSHHFFRKLAQATMLTLRDADKKEEMRGTGVYQSVSICSLVDVFFSAFGADPLRLTFLSKMRFLQKFRRQAAAETSAHMAVQDSRFAPF